MPRTPVVAACILVLIAACAALAASVVPPVEVGGFGRGPDVVLVHGLGGSTGDWLPTARVLARTHRVWLADLPGHGDTPMPAWFTLDQAVRALDESLPADRAVVLVGHSLGGLVCAAEAAAHPEHVRALVLVETALEPQLDGAPPASLMRELDAHERELVRGAFVSFGRDSVQGERRADAALAMDPAMLRSWIRVAWTDGVAGRPRIIVPVMAVLAPRSWGEHEAWSDVAAQLGYARCAKVTAVRLPGCGHFVMLDRPADLARLIDTFAALAPQS